MANSRHILDIHQASASGYRDKQPIVLGFAEFNHSIRQGEQGIVAAHAHILPWIVAGSSLAETMMFPAMAFCTPNILTPRRLLSDSLPFFELPTPFLCAMVQLVLIRPRPFRFCCWLAGLGGSYIGDEQLAQQLLPMSVHLLVALRLFLLKDQNFVAFQMLLHLGFYGRSFDWGFPMLIFPSF